MDGVRGYHAWRWVFILEGTFTVLLGILAFFIIPDWPENATFLPPDQRKVLLARLSEDAGPAVMDRLDRKALKRCFLDWKIYLG